VPGIVARPARNYETEQSAKLSIGDTGTSFHRRPDPFPQRRQMAPQDRGPSRKLFDGVSISGTIGETPQAPQTRRLTRDQATAGEGPRR